MSSNIAQSYPYSSESEAERSAAVSQIVAATEGLADKVKAEALETGTEDRSWVWKCPARGCPGLLHSAGVARNARAVYAVCDTCAKTYHR